MPLNDKTILITGGAGSVGTALVREILKHNIDTIRVFDISENEISRLRNNFAGEKRLRFLIGDVRDLNRLKLAMEGVDIVIHLAAMKHVYACEYNPFEAIKTNINGLQNVIDCAKDENVEKVIFTSTDKAARPLSVMGMTKLMGEKLVSLANYYKGNRRTIFASVRFGNVVGSNGSVIPLYKKQIINGEPIRINNQEMTRFVITMDEAVELILRAVELAKGGETFVWKMNTLKITDLADSMIAKYANGKAIKMNLAEKEEGEKIHEEIMSAEEILRAAELDNLYIIFPMIDCMSVMNKYQDLKQVVNPVIASNMGEHMSKDEISKLIDLC
ncbi:MAG: polysaccharide biosynthesis protein [Candidatus Staskawiczbacteria bacterium]|nr:polysaccharide biosynthesis protein [Candidatus Staskawiczbacteria bacterium]